MNVEKDIKTEIFISIKIVENFIKVKKKNIVNRLFYNIFQKKKKKLYLVLNIVPSHSITALVKIEEMVLSFKDTVCPLKIGWSIF